MELALSLFLGLVLFAAFGTPVAKFVRAISPALALVLAKLIRAGRWVIILGGYLLVGLALQEKKQVDDGERIALLLGATLVAALVHFLCKSIATALEVAAAVGASSEPEPAPAGRGIFAETNAQEATSTKPRRRQEAASAVTAPSEGVFEVSDEDGASWRVDLDNMTLLQENERYRLRRTSEGVWQVRTAGEAWESLEELDGHLATVIDTRWRRYVRG